MTTITGILEGVYNNEKSDAIKVSGKKITLKKGTGNGLLNLKGRNISVEVKEGEWQGKTTYMATGAVMALEGSPVTTNLASKSTYVVPSNAGDNKQESICFQSALKASLEFTQFTYGKSEEEKQHLFKEILKNTYRLARLSMNPDLFRPNPNTVAQNMAVPSGPNASDDYSVDENEDIESAVM